MTMPMVFGELGYRSIEYGHYAPYQSHGNIFNQAGKIETYNGENQANAYNAAFLALSEISWLEGLFIWQEEITNPPSYSNPMNTNYSLIGKPSASIIYSAFTGKNSDMSLPYVPSCLSVNFDYHEQYDFDTGGGIAKSNRDKDVWYTWTKFRIRPVSLCSKFSIFQEVQLGLWLSVAIGGGEIPFYESEYDWKRFLSGATIKSLCNELSWEIDLGIGKAQESTLAQNDIYKAEQEDTLFYLFSHLEWRRSDYGHKYFPKTILDFEGIGIFNSVESRKWNNKSLNPMIYDKRRFEFVLNQALIDIPFFNTSSRLTPGLVFGYGREYGESYFIKPGVGVTFGSNKKINKIDHATINFNYKYSDENQWEISFWVDIFNPIQRFYCIANK